MVEADPMESGTLDASQPTTNPDRGLSASNTTPPKEGTESIGAPPEQPALPSKPLRVVVVDDELAGLRHDHVEGDFYKTISDTTSPEYDDLITVARMTKGFAAIEAAGDQAISGYFESERGVQEILLSAVFAQKASPALKELLSLFLARANKVSALRQYFVDAFPSPHYELEFLLPIRPDIESVLSSSALFLDLFLENGKGDPVDELKEYLRKLGEQAAGKSLPPMILMSTHSELETHRRSFSEHSKISAAGLMILRKEEIHLPVFGAHGLRLAVLQLDRQREIATNMRSFMRAWTAALKKAGRKAAQTLWNLDASAMQQIHFSSCSDNDPYDEHLNELLSREQLAHVEADADVRASINVLDKCFREQFAQDGKGIENRFIAPLVDTRTSRDLMSRFTWLGSEPPQSFIHDDEKQSAANINRLMPFGSLLIGDDFASQSKCLVHITQQCDLNTISRKSDPSRTVVFAITEARAVTDANVPVYDTSELVARCLKVGDGEYDFVYQTGQMLAMPVSQFIELAKEKGLRVVGRLRHDIATHFVQATSNQLTRPASQKMTRASVVRAKVFLQGEKFTPQGFLGYKDHGKVEGKEFSITLLDDIYTFEDDACIWIALWIRQQLHDVYGTDDIDAEKLSTLLRKGWATGNPIADTLQVWVKNGQLSTAYKTVKTMRHGGNPQLSIVTEAREEASA